MKRIMNIGFKFILGLLLILIGSKGLSEVGINKTKVVDTVKMFENRILVPYDINLNLDLLVQHPTEILYFQNLCIIYGGFLLAFGFSLGKAFIMTGFLVDIIFVNQVVLINESHDWKEFSLKIGLIGGILNS